MKDLIKQHKERIKICSASNTPPVLEIGASGKLQIRRMPLDWFGNQTETRLLYASDLHLNRRTEPVAEALVDAVRLTQPHIILLGGDMVDFAGGLPLLANCIQRISQACPVYAIPGNHDEFVGIKKVRDCVEAAGGHWLEEVPLRIPHAEHEILIDGICQNRTNETAGTILCAHDPAIFPGAVDNGYRLVLAGHLHGSQFVLAAYRGRLYPGAWFFRWNGDMFTQGSSTMLVSRGMNDTLPVRWNCPREVLLCRIT